MGYLTNITDVLPNASYLATRYLDRSRNFITRRVYYENGMVKAFNGQDWWLVCEFTQKQIKRAKTLILDSGLIRAKDLKNEHVFDAAPLSFAYSLEGEIGMITNWCYPAADHPVLELLEKGLNVLENEIVIKNEK